MHTFRVLVTAGDNHPSFPAGYSADGIVVVDSRDHEGARQLALDRLLHLGWQNVSIQETVLLPEDPDVSSFSPLLLQAISVARELKVAFVVYPPKAT